MREKVAVFRDRILLLQERFAPGTSKRAFARLLGLPESTYQNWTLAGNAPTHPALTEALGRLGNVPLPFVVATWALRGQGVPQKIFGDAFFFARREELEALTLPAPSPFPGGSQASHTNPIEPPGNAIAILEKVKSGEVEPEEAWTTLRTLWKAGIAGLALLLLAQPRTASAADARRSHVIARRTRRKRVA